MAFDEVNEVTDRHLHIIWTDTDPLTAEHMVMMYATNSMLNGWWDRVTVVLWGGSQKLFLENEAVRLKAQIASNAGVDFSACVSCARNLGLEQDLKDAGIEVIRWGEKLSLLMQNDKRVLTI